MTLLLVAVVIALIAMAIGLVVTHGTARRAAATADAILILATTEPAAAQTEWRPIEEVRSALVDALADGKQHSVRLITSNPNPPLPGTPLQRYQALANLVAMGEIQARGALTPSTMVSRRQAPAGR